MGASEIAAPQASGERDGFTGDASEVIGETLSSVRGNSFKLGGAASIESKDPCSGREGLCGEVRVLVC